MATVQWLVLKHHKKNDGTYNPKGKKANKVRAGLSENSINSYMAVRGLG